MTAFNRNLSTLFALTVAISVAPVSAAPATKPKPQLPGCKSQTEQTPGPHALMLHLFTRPSPASDPVWALQAATSVQFESCQACLNAVSTLLLDYHGVATVTLEAWCIPTGAAEAEPTAKALEKGASGPSESSPEAAPISPAAGAYPHVDLKSLLEDVK